MSQDTDGLLSQITQDIDSQEVAEARKANERVNTTHGSDGRGLIVHVVQVSMPAKPDDLY